MNTLIKNNLNHILTTEVYYKDIENLKKVVNILNKDNFIIISGMIGVGKLNFIKFLLNSIGTNSGFLYFNIEFDSNNFIKSFYDINRLFSNHKENFGDPKIIILENIIDIPGIKDFINEIHKNKRYKLILIGNSIKIKGVKEVKIVPKLLNPNITELINYGRLYNILLIKNLLLKRKFLDLTKNDIILKDIILSFSVKQVKLLYQVITFLSLLNTSVSLRELHKNMENINIHISLITSIDYINYLLSSKMINRCYTYNLKIDKKVTSKAKYYFTDNGIRNSFGNFNIDKGLLEENFIFTQLLAKGYNVYNGKNGAFDFSFYGVKDPRPPLGIPPLQEEENNIFIHISKQFDKNELKKEVRKLLKIPGEGKRYLMITDDQIEKMKIKKFIYDDIVELIKFEELVKRLS